VLPVSTVTGDEIDPAAVQGALVGRPLRANRVKIIAITDRPLATLAAARELPAGQVGEIIVSGPTVTREYDHLPEATRLAKIQDPSRKAQRLAGSPDPLETSPTEVDAAARAEAGAVWHRMGDCGFLDAAGRLWYCGRVAERVETAGGPMYTEPCEQVFRGHPEVARCALIGLGPPGAQEPALVMQPVAARVDQARLAGELRSRARQHQHTEEIRRFFFHPRFPVDVRHNAKIHRLKLARWAANSKAGVVPIDK
jgi:acyl-CoA synthetase (AMP-forming)/AMP-acid ligase II